MKLALFFDEVDILPGQRQEIERLVGLTAANVGRAITIGRADQCYNIIVADDELIQQLNLDYRNKDSLTDVLSFSLGETEEVNGEVYICWSKVAEQAAEYGHSWQREFAFLAVHGILHLLGFEHGEEPNPQMREMEEKILDYMEIGRV